MKISGLLSKYLYKEPPVDIAELRAVFKRFKQILSGNNTILELMSQMEDKLSGEYIFDINFLKKITRRISSEIYKVVYNLNYISGNKYQELFSQHTEIRNELEEILRGFSKRFDNVYFLKYDEINSSLSHIVGTKNAYLGEIRNYLKLPAPDGFVLTTHAYQLFMEKNELWPKIQKIFNSSSPNQEGYARNHDRLIDELFADTKLPEEIEKNIHRYLTELSGHFNRNCRLAVRSSAHGEDQEDMSYAGQFQSFLNCPQNQIASAYIKVIASRFKYISFMYNREQILDPAKLAMAVGIQQLIPAETAGVIYSLDPINKSCDCMVISSVYGLGADIVAGSTDSDFFKISRLDPALIIERRIARKANKIVCDKKGSTKTIPVPEHLKNKPSLTNQQIKELAETALFLDRYCRHPLDIEWCFDDKGQLYILQCRPLKIDRKPIVAANNLKDILADKEIVMQKMGQVAQRGIVAGKVHLVEEEDDPASFPAGAIAVTKYTSPRLSAVIRRARAIISDVGSTTGHMATVAREFGVPLIVNTGQATQIFTDGDEITVDAEENIIYKGIIKELLEYDTSAEDAYRDLKEYKILRQLLQKISPLKLIDPKSARFTAKNCQTYHDILRFCHEKAMTELIKLNISSRRFRGIQSRKLNLSIPLDLIVIDLGGGLDKDVPRNSVDCIDEVKSKPMLAILKGLTAPGAWSTQPMQLGFSDLISSMTRYSVDADAGKYSGQNLAVISDNYVNLSLRLGYHFNVIDAYVCENQNDNYLYFRFVGGVTENERRHLRAVLLKDILEKLNFKVTVSGDLVIAGLKKWEAAETLRILTEIGRLVGFSRQLDTQMQSVDTIPLYVKEFFKH